MLSPSRWIKELLDVLRSEEDDEGVGDSAIPKVLTFLTMGSAAFLYIFVEIFLLTGSSLTGSILLLVGVAFVIETLPDVWLYHGPLKQEHSTARKFMEAHYVIELVAYVLLASAVFNWLPFRQFYVYSAFLAVWLVSFIFGEAVVLFIDKP